MFTALIVASLTCPAVPAAPVTAPPPSVLRIDEVDDKIAAAGEDVDKLLALADELKKAKDRAGAKRAFQRVIEIDADNKVARKGLRHQFYDGKWFTSYVELSKYKREEAARKKAEGLAKWKDQWVPLEDVPFLNMGWTKSEDGTWVNPIRLAEQKKVEELKAKGYQFRADDSSWVAPDDFEKWTNILFQCGDEWLDLEKADAYHSKIETAWVLAGDHFDVMTTCNWNTGNAARWHADQTHGHLVRLFGLTPESRPRLATLSSLTEYNELAATRPVFSESEGFSSLHGAYFADLTFDPRSDPPQYSGCGVSYWDVNDQKVAGWGPFWVRWAAAQSYVDAIDPSWKAIGDQMAAGGAGDGGGFGPAFWGEKKIPRWLRYGAASYAERFLPNPTAAEGADPWDLRAFACAEIKKAGGLHSMDEIFAFALTLDDLEGSSRLYHESGLIVSYLLDSGDKDVAAVHEAFRTALQSGDEEQIGSATAALQAELKSREKEIKKFAGL